MQTAIIITLLIIGLVLIVKGGDFFVDAATWMAEASGIPKVIIGATVVSIATTLPELIVSMIAAATGRVDLSIGNAVGSVTANTGLIMGIALVCMPTIIKRKEYLLRSLLMLAATAVLLVCSIQGSLGILPSIGLLVIFAVAIWDNVYQAKLHMSNTVGGEARPRPEKRVVTRNILKFILGTVGIVGGAQLLVDNGSLLAEMMGVPERIIGVTIIAIGTSLPELVTTLTAIAKKQASLSVGNIIGANIIDLTLILPLSALISGQALPFSSGFALIDMPACLIVGIICLVPTLFTQKFARWQGVLSICTYIGYVLLTSGIIG